MVVLVTGTSGYIAPRLAEQLHRTGQPVRCADRAEPTRQILSCESFIHGDLVEPAVAERAVAGVQAIYHLAAAKHDWGISDATFHRDNVEATERLLEAAEREGVRRFVFYSSVSALGGSGEGRVSDDDHREPTNAYGRSKMEAEDRVRAWADADPSRNAIVIRPSVVFGPGNPLNTNVQRVVTALDRKRFLMIGDGRTLKSTSYIDNLLAATEHVVANVTTPGFHVFTYVDDPVPSTGSLVRLISAELGMSPPRVRFPLWLAYPVGLLGDAAAALLRVDVPITGARIRKFCTSTDYSARRIRALGFRQPVTLEDAVAATVRWYRESVSGSRAAGGAR